MFFLTRVRLLYTFFLPSALSSPRTRNKSVSFAREIGLKHSGGVSNMRMYRSSDSDPVKLGDEAADEMLDVIYLKTMKTNFWFKNL